MIDKDRASAVLARAVDAELLVMLTGVERVALDYGTRWQRDMARLTVSDADRLLADGEFPPGSMGPKVESAARFVRERRSTSAIVTCAERLLDAVEGAAGTRIVPDARGPVGHRMDQPDDRRRGVSWHVRVIANRYADSVRLMSIARAVRERDGVARCELGMGTPANLEAARRHRRAGAGDPRGSRDRGRGRRRRRRRRARVGRSASSPRGRRRTAATASHARARARSLALAARELDGANVALISVPGEYAVLEAHRALSSGMHVFLFSDHVPLEAEIELKRRGAELGLLVMGPECGTAMLGGIGLGFANVVRPGSCRDRRRRRHRRAGVAPACSTRPASACLTSSASADATCPPRSAR